MIISARRGPRQDRVRIAPGRVSDQVWAFWDFLPTAAELAGVEPPKNVDGLSIVPTLLGRSDQQRAHEYLYWEYNQNQAIRTGDWFGHRKNGGRVELYDLAQDPQQRNDLARKKPQLAAKILRWMDDSHTSSEVWPSPGESRAEFQKRLERDGIPPRPTNIDG